MKIQANGSANQQVAQPVKDAIEAELQQYGVNPDATLITHYQNGDWVSVSLRDTIEDITDWNDWQLKAINSYWRNRDVGDDAVWLHREYIQRYLFADRQASD